MCHKSKRSSTLFSTLFSIFFSFSLIAESIFSLESALHDRDGPMEHEIYDSYRNEYSQSVRKQKKNSTSISQLMEYSNSGFDYNYADYYEIQEKTSAKDLNSEDTLLTERFGTYFQEAATTPSPTTQKVGVVIGAAPAVVSLATGARNMLDAVKENKTYAAAAGGLQALSALCFIAGTLSLATGIVPLAAFFMIAGAGLGVIGAFLPKDEVPNPLALLDKEFKQLKSILGNIEVKIDKIILKIEDITKRIQELSGKLDQVKTYLNQILDTIHDTDKVIKFENRIKPILFFRHNLTAADAMYNNIKRYRDTESMENFLKRCAIVKEYPFEITVYFVNDTFELKKKVIIPDEQAGFDEEKYVDYALSVMSVLYHALHISTICLSLENMNKTDEERKVLQNTLVQKAQDNVIAFANQYDTDRFFPIQRYLNVVRKEAELDNGKSVPETFTRRVFKKLIQVNSTAKLLFVSWIEQQNSDNVTFYPYRQNDKSIDILHKDAKGKNAYSFVHYWFGKWKRNMVLYIRGNYEVHSLWEFNVNFEISKIIKNWNSEDKDLTCKSFFEQVRRNVKQFKNDAIGCFPGESSQLQENLVHGNYIASHSFAELTVFIVA